jgi:4-hydroxy-3-methylbut-2-en-1-yl diphosphate synthase (EC 1.17.4.3)
MEFLRICVAEHFNDVVISIKASNTVVMVRTVRLLVEEMEKEAWLSRFIWELPKQGTARTEE